MVKRIWRGYQQHRDGVLIFLGLLAVSLIVLPYLVLGEGSYVQVHDQLDGEVLNYIYQARYLGQGDVIPQFMNGMDKASMLPPAPLGVLLYRLFPPFAAYGVMHWFCLAAGFLGMYGLCRKIKLRAEVSWAAACMFCYIPFYPTYGLAALGQPMLVLCGLYLREGDTAVFSDGSAVHERKKDGAPFSALWRKARSMTAPLLAIALFAACSSLTLVGYVWAAVGIFCTVCLAVAGRRKKSGYGPAFRVGGGTLVLLAVYLVCNGDLLRSLRGDGFTTHRQEMALRATEHPLASLKELFFEGGSYSPVYSAGILAAAALLTLAVLMFSAGGRKFGSSTSKYRLVQCRRRGQRYAGRGRSSQRYSRREERGIQAQERDSLKKNIQTVWGVIGLIFCGALLAVLWNCGPVVSLRLSIGGMVAYFQADRIYWCFPFLWMLVLGLVLEGICRLGEQMTAGIRFHVISFACCLMLLGIEGLQILRDSTLNKNLRLMLLNDYEQVTWESIYMNDVFARIDRVIGADKDSCSVVSLGIYPSVALYHGYTCADGYSNNYDLAYKHRFRQTMARELEENDGSRRYFDEWGNRLYLAGAPYGINGTVAKGQTGYTDLDYDLDVMRSLNIRYLLAAAPVELSRSSREQTSLRLELVEGSPFTDDTAYYEVWVYRIDLPSQP